MEEFLLASVAAVSRVKNLAFTPAPALIDAFIDVDVDSESLSSAVALNIPRLVQRLLRQFRDEVLPEQIADALTAVIRDGNLVMMQVLFMHQPENAAFPDEEGGAGVANVMAWLETHYDGEYVRQFFQELVCSKNVALAQWVYGHWHTGHFDVDLDAFAGKAGSVATLEWLHTLPPSACKFTVTTEAIDRAAMNGRLDLVQWFHANRTEGCTTNAMDYAAMRGDLDTVQWLHANRTEGCTTEAMDSAATNGKMAVVDWLHANRTEGCTADAMDFAAIFGHLEIVQFLHANRMEGCTTLAMDEAAQKGNLEIVHFLHDNRHEGCTTSAMDDAAYSGHLDVIKYLHVNRSEGCTRRAMTMAAHGGHRHVVEWLSQNRAEGCEPETLEFATGRWHSEMLPYLKVRSDSEIEELRVQLERSRGVEGP